MIKVGIIFGGKSAEHEVSIISAGNILEALDKSKFEPVLVGVSQDGNWFYCENGDWIPKNFGNCPKIEEQGIPVALVPGSGSTKLVTLDDKRQQIELNAAFPIIHGTYGEDGTLQGLFEHLNIPYVGPDTLGSAMSMDKDIAKRILHDAGIKITKHVLLRTGQKYDYEQIFSSLKRPLFVKPANAGSSIGVSKVTDEKELTEAIKHAFLFDNKILIEEGIEGREIECAVLGNESPEPSPIGEIVPVDKFYSYKAKYLDENGAELHAPADLTDAESELARSTALDAYQALCCEGLARVDMFLTADGQIYVNEINTLPGFTKISMYPTLWQKNGMTYSDLITKLIELAQSRYDRQRSLRITMPEES